MKNKKNSASKATPKIIRVLNNFLSLIYPNCCASCNNDLVKTENSICMFCETDLPKVNFHDIEENPVEKTLYGRFDYRAATAFLYFSKKGLVHKLLHELKYRNNTTLGVRMGELFGVNLQKSTRFKEFDVLIPVPLHPKKEKERGYNQALKLAEGMNIAFGTKISNNNLFRNIANPTQTKKNRWQRWENVATIFGVKDPKELENKKVLLIDDVITTGSTIEACAIALSQIRGLELSIACLALPRN